MARSPSDATRFTATGPYAASSNSFASSAPRSGTATLSGTQIDFGSAPAGETPQQKIQRLRAAASLARRGKESTFDTVVRVGRVWADRAHRVTAVGLIGLTVVTACVATAGITDMLLHNRKRRNEWLAEQQARTAKDTAEARRAMAIGSATEDQMLLINRQRAAEEAAEARKNRPGMFKRATGWLFSDLSSEEQKGGRLGAMAAGAGSAVAAVTPTQRPEGQKHDRSVLQAVEEKLDANRRQGEKVEEVLRPRGGPLDRQAQLVVDTAAGSSRSWMDWVTRR
ncbi:hypothetical protein LTR22_016846 [Elasticomyces elasticus]|uniref:Uncharacterized protein n=1 Tax=Elasticomyces elasticus TaxID=574655 RepID=A0AAN7ZLD6_9PEZI|nr:hypothetical protein LTR22_016846 [Elasticomyces elasticus]KAK4916522.1 hypothetical protein LTR49_015490 [Elasticomyces elasticus]KAK5692568.1 hypothetical protein LTR97_010879 [Elasticomyces elasticus]KAK5755778.1 hypothetical protein LTS12_014131 [Elasticomyces elasticus]